MVDVWAAEMAAKRLKQGRRGERGRPSSGGFDVFTYFPLLAIPVVVYNIIAWTGLLLGGSGSVPERMSANLFCFPMASQTEIRFDAPAEYEGTCYAHAANKLAADTASGAVPAPEAGKKFTTMTRSQWAITPGDLLLAISMILLFIELLKSTSTGKSAIINHSFSMIIFIVCLVEFLLFAPFATSVFFLITLMALLDVLAGFIVTIVTARRDIAVGDDFNA